MKHCQGKFLDGSFQATSERQGDPKEHFKRVQAGATPMKEGVGQGEKLSYLPKCSEIMTSAEESWQ